MRTLIIDDEENARKNLRNILLRKCPEVILEGEATNVNEGIKLIEELKPELVFLDVEMPDGTGIDLLAAIEHPKPYVIFVTAYDQYAIEAIKQDANDYILKPISPNELKIAVNKIQKKKSVTQNTQEGNDGMSDTIMITCVEGVHFIKQQEIIRVQADGNYASIYTLTDKVTATKTLKEMESSLSPKSFIRVHQSHLVNRTYIKKFMKGEHSYLIMNNNEKIEVSRRKKQEFIAKMSESI